MNTDEHGCAAVKKKRRCGRGGRMPAAGPVDEGYRDPLARAVARERDHARVPPWPLEEDCAVEHVFRCVCCGRLRGDQERREGRSLVCIRCVREAGYWN
jgi:hypothetical protein